jgi:hypothetical protein
MSIIFMDGFERSSYSQWDSVHGVFSIGTGTLTGSYHSNYNGYDNSSVPWAYKILSTNYSQLYVSMKYWHNNTVWCPIFAFSDSAGTTTASIVRNASNNIEIRLGTSAGAVLATSTNNINANIVYCIEIYYKPLNSGGEITVKVDGVQSVTYSGDTTAGLENVRRIIIGHTTGNGNSMNMKWDDIVVSDSGWLGNQYIQLITPNASGDSTQWTPSTGNNYDCVNEVVASDTDYISTNTTDNTDLYNLTSLTGSIKSVTAIDVSARMSYYGTPTPTKQKIAIKSTGEYYGDDISPALSYVNYNYIWDQNPATSAAWLESEINSLQVGVKAIA